MLVGEWQGRTFGRYTPGLSDHGQSFAQDFQDFFFRARPHTHLCLCVCVCLSFSLSLSPPPLSIVEAAWVLAHDLGMF